MAARKKKTARKTVNDNPSLPPVEVTDGLYVLRRPFPPGVKYCGLELDWQQIFSLRSSANDSYFIRVQQFAELTEHDVRNKSECGKCGAEFASMPARDRHYKLRHEAKPKPSPIKNLEELSPGEMRALVESTNEYGAGRAGDPMPEYMRSRPDPDELEANQADRFAEEVAPLHLDKTEASRS